MKIVIELGYAVGIIGISTTLESHCLTQRIIVLVGDENSLEVVHRFVHEGRDSTVDGHLVMLRLHPWTRKLSRRLRTRLQGVVPGGVS